MATIPSDLPMIISSIAHSCANRLKHEADVVCSEPAALLIASTVNQILFDKTGTMTTDTQSLAMVRTRHESEEFLANLVLAGCHSLVDLNRDMIGDPLDLTAFRNSGWNMNDQDSRRFSRKVGKYPFGRSRHFLLMLLEGPLRHWSWYTVETLRNYLNLSKARLKRLWIWL